MGDKGQTSTSWLFGLMVFNKHGLDHFYAHNYKYIEQVTQSTSIVCELSMTFNYQTM